MKKILNDFSINYMEKYKEISEIPGFYADSNGNIYNSAFIKIHTFESGYPSPKNGSRYLYVNINRKLYLVHRIIAKTFIENPNNLPQVNHKNGVKSDPRVENLEWCSRKYNQEHSHNILGNNNKGENNVTSKLTNEEVLQIVNLINKGYTQRDVAKMFGVSKSTIAFINNGSTWTHVTGINNEKYHCKRRKLTEDDVRLIRHLSRDTNMSQKEIADMFGITRSAVGNIKHNRIWKKLE